MRLLIGSRKSPRTHRLYTRGRVDPFQFKGLVFPSLLQGLVAGHLLDDTVGDTNRDDRRATSVSGAQADTIGTAIREVQMYCRVTWVERAIRSGELMFASRKPKDHKSSSSCMRHSLAAVIQKTGKGNFANWKDPVGDFLPKSRLSEIESYRTGLGTAWQRECEKRDNEQELDSQKHDSVLSFSLMQ